MRESPYKERRCVIRRISLAPLLNAFSVQEMMRSAVQLFAATISGMLLVGSLPAQTSQLAKVKVLSRRARLAMGRAFPRRKRASVVWALTLLALLAALGAPSQPHKPPTQSTTPTRREVRPISQLGRRRRFLSQQRLR